MHRTLATSGCNARAGVNALTSLGAITGDNRATGVGLAAIYLTFVNLAIHGVFREAACETGDKDCEHPHKNCKSDARERVPVSSSPESKMSIEPVAVLAADAAVPADPVNHSVWVVTGDCAGGDASGD